MDELRAKLYRTEAIVLKRVDLGEADKIITLYTPGMGKIRAVAKGVRKTTSRLGGNVELFTHCALRMARGRNLDVITESETRHSFKNLRESLATIAQANYAAELLDKMAEEGIENYPAWQLLLDTLSLLDEGKDPRTIMRGYQLYLLSILGYRPQLQQCANCQAEVEAVTNYFSPSSGGILCPLCQNMDRVARPITPGSLKILRYMQRENMAGVVRLRLSEGVQDELGNHLTTYITYILERELKSAQFIQTLSRLENGPLKAVEANINASN